ncbi:tautomerase family protein [Nocardia vinacea]|uniref:tautomerase family protein n=1 Tax=Nocardia vinacea TaxID=96468 RepID=UPI0002F94FF0|nr:tautomerase family protein [Nocardia vinacea]
MPLVRIDVIEGRRNPDQLRTLADAVHEVMLGQFAAPDRDRYQIITEHKPHHIIVEDTGLGFTRSDDVVVIQILQQGRTDQQKKDTYRALAEGLESATGLNPADLIISVTGNSRADWSFGYGVAQFLEGNL